MTKDEFVKAITKKGNIVFDLLWCEQYFSELEAAEIGEIMCAVYAFCQTGEICTLTDRGLTFILKTICTGIWKKTECYIERCEKNRENGKKGGKQKAENQHQNDEQDAFWQNAEEKHHANSEPCN